MPYPFSSIQAAMMMMTGGKAATWQEQLLAQFPGGDDVGVWYSSSQAARWIYQHIGANRYWKMKIGDAAIGANAGAIANEDVCTLYKAFNDQTTPAVTFNGSWTCSSDASYVGGRIMYKFNVAGSYMEITANCTTLGIVAPAQLTNLGIALVSIDGDKTLADLLPTAQQLVDAGTIANTCLVANGGTLNPTDRIYDEYSRTSNLAPTEHGGTGGGPHMELFTTSLAQGNHTLRITYLGYKNIASSGVTVQVFELIATSPLTRTTTPGYDLLVRLQSTMATGGAPEISYSFLPTGATTYKWLGHAGQAKVTTPIAVTVDGVVTALTSNVRVAGSEIILTQTSSIRHSEVGGGATNLGTYAITYKLNKSTGLTISHTVTWATNGSVQGYPCMLAVDHAVYDRYKTYQNAEQDLATNDGADYLNSNKNMAWAWDLDGNQAKLIYIPSLTLTVEDWAKAETGHYLVWRDTADDGAAWRKAYVFRYRTTAPIATFANNDSIQSEANYRLNWFTDGANAALAGKY